MYVGKIFNFYKSPVMQKVDKLRHMVRKERKKEKIRKERKKKKTVLSVSRIASLICDNLIKRKIIE